MMAGVAPPLTCGAWTVPMDRFLSIEAFVRVAETRSFAEAARQLGVTNSVVTHRVQQLERFIEAPLFHRSTRHVRLSEVGETYYKRCAEAVCMLTDLTDQMRGLRATPAGKLRIRMLPGYALSHFAAPLARFGAQYPDIQLDVVVDDVHINSALTLGEDVADLGGEILGYCVEAGGSITGEHGVGADKAEYMPRMFSEDDLDEDDEVVHVLEAAPAFGVGATVHGTIDWTRRFDHMQQHTGQHLLSAVFEDLIGAKTVSVHFGAQSATLDLDVETVTRAAS